MKTIETKQNFISLDRLTARDSYGTFYTVGEEVGHESTEDSATILSFEEVVSENEIFVHTTKGRARLDFLTKWLPEEPTELRVNDEYKLDLKNYGDHCWLIINDVSLRIGRTDDFTHVDAYVKGHEDEDEEFVSMGIDHEEVAKVLAADAKEEHDNKESL